MKTLNLMVLGLGGYLAYYWWKQRPEGVTIRQAWASILPHHLVSYWFNEATGLWELVDFDALPVEGREYQIKVSQACILKYDGYNFELQEGWNAIVWTILVSGIICIRGGMKWHEGLEEWVDITDYQEIPQNKDINILTPWVNTSEISIVGHIDLIVQYPNGDEAPLLAILNQDKEAAPGNGGQVLFEPFNASQVGTYTLTGTLSSSGWILDSVVFHFIVL